MKINKINPKTYKPIKDRLYRERMVMRLMHEPSFKTCFKRDVSSKFINSIKDLYSPDRLFRSNTIIAVSGGTGCQPKGSKVLMANGEWKEIQDVKIDDEVISPQEDGSNIFSKVINTTNWFCEENYDIIQLNKDKKKLYSCSYNHLIPTYHRYFPRIKGVRDYTQSKIVIKNYKTSYFSKMSNNKKSHNNIGFSSFLIPKFKGKNNCEIEPYTLGVYLGDGHSIYKIKRLGNQKIKVRQLGITTSYKEIINEVGKYYKILSIGNKKGTNAKLYRFSLKGKLYQQLFKENLIGKKSGDKFIPKKALLSSSNYRKKLLAGLIDTDGSLCKKGSISYTSKSKKLVDDIKFLVYSLGGRCNIKQKIGKIKKIGFVGKYYQMSIYLHDLKLPQKLKHKISKSNRVYLSSNRIAINSVRNNHKQVVYGFTLDSPSGLYITDNFMITHNSGKSLCMLSLAKLTCPNWTEKNMKFFDQELLDLLSDNVPEDTLLVRDEEPSKAIYGLGSMRIDNQIDVVADTCRKHGLSLIFIEPEFKKYDIAKWYLETIDMGSAINEKGERIRVNRLGLREPTTMKFIGGVYIPIVDEDDLDWVAYNERKDEFIKSVLKAEFNGAKMDYEEVARKLLDEMDLAIYKTKLKKELYVRKKYPNLTNQEIKMILASMDIVEDEQLWNQ